MRDRPANEAERLRSLMAGQRRRFHFVGAGVCSRPSERSPWFVASTVRSPFTRLARQAGHNKMSFPLRMPRGSSSPPTAGDPRDVPFSAMQELRSTGTDEAPTPRPSQPSPFTDLGDFSSQERLGDTLTGGPRALPFASLGGLTPSLQGFGLHPHPPARASSRMETSRRASGEYGFLFVGSGGGGLGKTTRR